MLPPEISIGNSWRIHSDEKVGKVIAHVRVRNGEGGDAVVSVQKSGTLQFHSPGTPSPFGEDGSPYFRVVKGGRDYVVLLAKSLKNFKVRHT